MSNQNTPGAVSEISDEGIEVFLRAFRHGIHDRLGVRMNESDCFDLIDALEELKRSRRARDALLAAEYSSNPTKHICAYGDAIAILHESAGGQ